MNPPSDVQLRKFDKLSPSDAALKAWITPGVNPAHHADMQVKVRESMPLLARALDRAAGTTRGTK